jgi:cell division septum initiation protein DivIVA
MAERLGGDTPFERLNPEEVSTQAFAVARKGFDQKQVQAYLVSLGNQIKAGQQQIRDLREQVAQLDAQPEPEPEFSTQGVKLLDDGMEASRRLAQTEANEMAARASRLAEKLDRSVEDLRSRQDLSDAGELLELLEQAGEQAQAVTRLLQEAREQAEAEVEHGRVQGREIVEQAKTLRLTVLRDMARRRQTARAQVERLRAGRDKLMATLSEARHSIEQSMEAAKLSLAEAKVVADAAARRVEDETEPTDLALLSELDDAQVVGMVPGANATDGDTEEVHESVTLLPPAERDPVEAAADHPVLTNVGDSSDVDAIFARLRSQSDVSQGDGETAPGAAKTPVGDE